MFGKKLRNMGRNMGSGATLRSTGAKFNKARELGQSKPAPMQRAKPISAADRAQIEQGQMALQQANPLQQHSQRFGPGQMALQQANPLQQHSQRFGPGQMALQQANPLMGKGLAGLGSAGKMFKKGGKVKAKASSASKKADGVAIKGKTKGRFV